jgi:hypothetical protein
MKLYLAVLVLAFSAVGCGLVNSIADRARDHADHNEDGVVTPQEALDQANKDVPPGIPLRDWLVWAEAAALLALGAYAGKKKYDADNAKDGIEVMAIAVKETGSYDIAEAAKASGNTAIKKVIKELPHLNAIPPVGKVIDPRK